MDAKDSAYSSLIQQWFHLWEIGDYAQLPLSDDFSHKSPFGEIKGKAEYLNWVAANEEKFTGQEFEIHEILVGEDSACCRYTAKQGQGFSLEVSEWYRFKAGLIQHIQAYYHIGEIRADRKLKPA